MVGGHDTEPWKSGWLPCGPPHGGAESGRHPTLGKHGPQMELSRAGPPKVPWPPGLITFHGDTLAAVPRQWQPMVTVYSLTLQGKDFQLED